MKKYESVMERVRFLIDGGTLESGQRAPSVRSMAEQTGFSLMTVLDAYHRLENMGFLIARQRLGYYVRPKRFWQVAKHRPLPTAIVETGHLSPRTVKIDDKVATLLEEAYRPGVIPLGAGVPSPEFFPSEQLSLCMSRVVRSDAMGVNQYSLTPGERDLRRQLALRMLESGCTVSEDDVMVTGGATDGLILALRCLTRPGDTIAIESPGYFGFYRAAVFLGLKVVEIPSDPQEGLVVSEFNRLVRRKTKLRCLLLCPCVSNPTGAAMPDDRKDELLEAAQRASVTIIEDDTYGELYFSDHRPRSLKSFGGDEVIQIGGLGKTLAPGYRIGWLAGGKFHGELQRLHGMAYLAVATPNQLAVARFLANGWMARHLRTIRSAYRDNVRLFQLAVAEFFPSFTRVSDPTGGHFLWIQMPKDFDSLALAQEAINKNVSIAPGVVFSSGQRYINAFRVNCAVTWSPRVEAAIRILGSLSVNLKLPR